jgi:(E)-4-hydroxy-3-methylbut-2-enyl-diphosphate synthase
MNIGASNVPVVIADLSKIDTISHADLKSIGYSYDEATDKWNISDSAADYIFTGHNVIDFALPGTLKTIVYPATWMEHGHKHDHLFPIFQDKGFIEAMGRHEILNFVMIDCYSETSTIEHLDAFANDPTVVICFSSKNQHAMPAVRRAFMELLEKAIKNPVILITDSNEITPDEHLVHFSTETGALFLDGFGDGICLGLSTASYQSLLNDNDARNSSGRNYLQNLSPEQFLNNAAFTILQATRTRISKTEYISCPSCGRTLFDLQETTSRIRSVTNHLKGVKIAIMGCIVNGPGEMADADFGYVGSGVGKITLYKGKDVMKRNVNSAVAVDELINLLKESGAWTEPANN